jgi:hypothetical protein
MSQLDDSVAVGFAMLGTPVLSYITRMVGTIAHTSPTLRFNELIIANYFGIPDNLLRILIVSITNQAFLQSLKVSPLTSSSLPTLSHVVLCP